MHEKAKINYGGQVSIARMMVETTSFSKQRRCFELTSISDMLST